MGDSAIDVTVERLTETSEADVDGINSLLPQLKPSWNAITVADLEDVLSSPTRVYVARIDAVIVGLTLMVPHRHFGGLRYHVEDVVVRDEYRRRGIARCLLEAAIADAPPETVSFDLRSHHLREAAHKLYSALGFVASDTTVFRRAVNVEGDAGLRASISERLGVRPATPADADAIRTIFEDWIPTPEAERRAVEMATVEEAHPAGRAAFVACIAGDVVGVAGVECEGIAAELVSPSDRTAELVGVYVARRWLGKGVGQALVEAAERHAAAYGFDVIVVVSGARNQEFGYPFWTRRYGEPFRRDDDYFGPGFERVVWRHHLTSGE